jgi:L-ascorbate metabolism protein UlaG (beta-lactamase superfamily)
MKIKYFGHAAFELALENGKKLVFDPYKAGAFGTLTYGAIEGTFDIAIVSHDHDDHSDAAILSRARKAVWKAGKVTLDGIPIESVSTFHDDRKGGARGKNLISIVEAEGLRVAHMGDLGHSVSAKDYPMLAGLDVLMIPVGGHFTIDAATAAGIVKELSPMIAIPMHYKTPKADFPIAPVEDFTKLMDNVETPGSSEIDVTKATLPAKPKVVVLTYAN